MIIVPYATDFGRREYLYYLNERAVSNNFGKINLDRLLLLVTMSTWYNIYIQACERIIFHEIFTGVPGGLEFSIGSIPASGTID